MRVVFSTRFRHEIAIISKFIALDSKKRANAFINSVEKQCSTLSNMPYSSFYASFSKTYLYV